MSFSAGRILPYARAYAALVGCGISETELREEITRRAAGLPAWGRLAAAAGAWAIRWWAPLFVLGKLCRFESLSSGDADELLRRLQCTRLRAVKGMFMAVKAVVLPACYGTPRFMNRIGYALTEDSA